MAAPTNSARSVAMAMSSAWTHRPHDDRAREVLAAQLGQVAAGRDADLRREVLDQHRHQVRREQHPQQQVAVLRAAGDVRGEVAGVDVGDAGDERRARAAPACRARGRARARCCSARLGRTAAERRRPASAMTLTAPPASRAASAPPRTWTSSPKRANSGPSKGCLSMTSKLVAGRDPALGQVAQHLRVGVRDAHEASPRAPASSVGQRASSALLDAQVRASGSGRRAGRRSGCRAWRRSAPRAPRRGRARAPRPRRGRGPTARRATRRGRARAAGGGGGPRARRARPASVSSTPR